MRYICEFEYSPVDYKSYANTIEELIEYQKRNGNHQMGIMIGENIGWEQYSADEFQRHKLEIQAFSQKDWREFKDNIKAQITLSENLKLSTYPYIIVLKLIERLERVDSKPLDPSGVTDKDKKKND